MLSKIKDMNAQIEALQMKRKEVERALGQCRRLLQKSGEKPEVISSKTSVYTHFN